VVSGVVPHVLTRIVANYDSAPASNSPWKATGADTTRTFRCTSLIQSGKPLERIFKEAAAKHLKAASSRLWIATGAGTTGTVHKSHSKRYASSLHNDGMLGPDVGTSEDYRHRCLLFAAGSIVVPLHWQEALQSVYCKILWQIAHQHLQTTLDSHGCRHLGHLRKSHSNRHASTTESEAWGSSLSPAEISR